MTSLFDYLLNAFEHASQSKHPAVDCYADKRRALLEYVRKLESSQDLLREARQFLNAQAYTREEMDDFCKRLDAFYGIESDR